MEKIEDFFEFLDIVSDEYKDIVLDDNAPASSLYGDTRDYAKFTNQVVAVYIKKKDEALFYDLKYTAKGFDVNSIDNNEILNKIKK